MSYFCPNFFQKLNQFTLIKNLAYQILKQDCETFVSVYIEKKEKPFSKLTHLPKII